LTGVLLRGSNIKIDLRLIGYEYYSNIRFNVVTGVKGDCLSRYLIRMNEMLESVKIIQNRFRCITIPQDCLILTSTMLRFFEYATKLGCLSFKIELTNLSLSIKVYFVGYLHIIIKDKR